MKQCLLLVLMLCNMVAFGQSLPAYVPAANIEAWFPFSGNAADSSGNNNDGVLAGAELVSDRFGHPLSAFHFNGTSDHIIIPPGASLDLTRELTISVWIRPDNYYVAQAQIYWRGDVTTAYDPYLLCISLGQIKFRRNVGNGDSACEVGFPITAIDTATFHFLVGTYSEADDSMKLYCDGLRVAAAYCPMPVAYSTTGFWNTIGAVDHGNWQNYQGIIDDIGSWNRRLSDCEISKLYMAQSTLIVRDPVNATAVAGGQVAFSINDTGGGAATFQWQEDDGSGFADLANGGAYSGATTKILRIHPVSVAMNTFHYRCVRITNICSDTSAAAVLYSTPAVGINPLSSADELAIVPNPSTGSFSFTGAMPCSYTGAMVLSVTDILARLVYSSNVAVENGRIKDKVNVKEAGSGTYFVKLQCAAYSGQLKLTIH